MKNIKISFDYDNILSETKWHSIVRSMVEAGLDVYMITSRFDSTTNDPHVVCDFVGICKENRYFTEGSYKAEIINRLGIDIHFDANMDDVQVTRILSKCFTVNL